MDASAEPHSQPREVFHLWPEHVEAVVLWSRVQSQWRHGMAGPTGLDYAGVRASPAFRRLPRKDRERVFEDVCVMESAALEVFCERQKS